MEKRITRSDYFLLISFITVLILLVGAFMYGYKMGTDRASFKYEELIKAKDDKAKGPVAYDQPSLVSFYHNIYAPYKEFQVSYFEQLQALETNSKPSDFPGLLKDLSRKASDTYEQMLNKSMPEVSPLLVQGHQNYLKSLKLFADTLKSFQNGATRGTEFVLALNRDPFLIEAQNFGLNAQLNYYDAILKWNLTSAPNLKLPDLNKKLTLSEWSALGLNAKDMYVANWLQLSKVYKPYHPQDIALRVDDTIANGQAKKLGLADVYQVMDLLITTDAVRSGDFTRSKNKFYGDETVPQIPIFTGTGSN